jgi:nicotinate phosphoribosyltransferase
MNGRAVSTNFIRNSISVVSKHNLALLTDFYELTMAYGYWKSGMVDKEAVFHLFFRKKPFHGPFAIAAGLQSALEFLKNFHFDASDLAYLESLKVFEKPFLDYLSNFKLRCDIDAVPEGTAVFQYEPLLRVQGSLIDAQLLEGLLLNIINFQTLIATKAARICAAAHPDPVIEFGMRRAQGIDGAISASRAAFIGGCPSTSNVIAGKLFGIPVKGTHAHSWIMAFPDEIEAFKAWGKAMPSNVVFLVDTYDTIHGTKKAIDVAKKLKNVQFAGVRIDSGDLAQLSIQVRKLLDEAGFSETRIMASNELDETLILDLKQQGAKINLWGVGTHLVTGKDQPALDGVYKLSVIRDSKSAPWQYKMKLSEQLVKTTDPGILQIRRFSNAKGHEWDMIYDELLGVPSQPTAVSIFDPTKKESPTSALHSKDLLVPVMRGGKVVYTSPPLTAIQQHAKSELQKLKAAVRRFTSPQIYFVGLEQSLFDLKLRLIEELKH